jgi:hypothetical protein
MVIRELVSVEARESFGRAEPEKAVRVLNDAENVIAGQTIGGSIRFDWQALRVKERSDQERS